jgi:hypothetical protein
MNFALIEASDIDVEGLSVRFVQNRPLGSIPIVAWLCKSASTRDYYPPTCGPGLARATKSLPTWLKRRSVSSPCGQWNVKLRSDLG